MEVHPEGEHGHEKCSEAKKNYISRLFYSLEVSRNGSGKGVLTFIPYSTEMNSKGQTYAQTYERVPKHVLEIASPIQSTLWKKPLHDDDSILLSLGSDQMLTNPSRIVNAAVM